MEDSTTINDFGDYELLEEIESRGIDLTEKSNLKDDTDRGELIELFFSKSWAEREEILKKLRE